MNNIPASCPLELIVAANTIQSGNPDLAKIWLNALEFEDDISIICKEALLNENPEYIANLYHDNPENQTKQIDLFDLIFRHLPSASETTTLAMKSLENFYVQQSNTIQHINIGIGKGLFEKQLFTQLAHNNQFQRMTSISIIGVDIDTESLIEAKQNIESIQPLFPDTELLFLPILADIENVNDDFLGSLRMPNTALGIISAFTLHHIRTSENRNRILSILSKLKPDLFLLVEPNSDHFIPDLVTRTQNCWTHFQKSFQLVDNQAVSEEVKLAIKYRFFGREIQNILSSNENQRFEKHENMEVWQSRLMMADFHPNHSVFESFFLPPDFEKSSDGILSFCFEEMPLVSLFAFGS